MKEVLIDVETGERITVNTEGTYEVSREQRDLVWRTFLRNERTRLFSNVEKKRYLVRKWKRRRK